MGRSTDRWISGASDAMGTESVGEFKADPYLTCGVIIALTWEVEPAR